MSKNKNIIILGVWNTGTNLISNIFDNNSLINLKTNEVLNICNDSNKIWKHNPKCALIEELAKDNNNIIIIMYRNIYTWLNSMKKASYELHFENLASVATIKNNKHDIDISFRNIIHAYNHYYHNYMKLSIQYPNVVFFDYRKIINQDTCFEYMNFKLSKLNLTLTTKYKVIQQLIQPAKTHGMSVKDSTQAVEKYDKTIFMMKIEVKKYNITSIIDQNIIDYFENDY